MLTLLLFRHTDSSVENFPGQYFKDAESVLFRWDDEGNVLVWYNGTTIAFRAELAAVVERLAEGSIPPLNAIAVLFSACRENWDRAREYLQFFAAESSPSDEEYSSGNSGPVSPLKSYCPEFVTRYGSDFAYFLKHLDRIHAMSADLRTDLRAQCELAAMVFESCHKRRSWLGKEQAKAIAELFSQGLPEEFQSQTHTKLDLENEELDGTIVLDLQTGVSNLDRARATLLADSAEHLLADLRWMQDGLPLITEDAWRRRLKTGIEDRVKPAVTRSPKDSQPLIGELLDDKDLAGLARLARDLQALLTFPRQIFQPDDLPLGGVSDITNRGQLDRLLLSELAHDDLTLSTRLAVNEALFLQREMPPAVKSTRRRVLLDTGLCMWGVPRLFATAVGLSLAESSQQDVTTEFWRREAGELNPVDLSSRSGLDEHLGILTSELHPAPGLKEFFVQESIDGIEFVIVTHFDVMSDPEFRVALGNTLPHQPVFVIALDRTGQLLISSVHQHGFREVRKGVLHLEQLLESGGKRQSPISDEADLPIIFQQEEFPLRLYHQVNEDRGFRAPMGVITCSSDGRLMLWDQTGLGGRQLSDQIGRGQICWFGEDPSGNALIVYGSRAASSLKIICVTHDATATITHLTYDDDARVVTGHNGYVIVEFSNRWEMFQPGRPDSVSRQDKSGMFAGYQSLISSSSLSAASRFLKLSSSSDTAEQWFALAEFQGELRLQRVPLPDNISPQCLLERRGHGIIAFCDNGDIHRLYGDEDRVRLGAGSNWRVTGVDSNGTSFLASNTTIRQTRLVLTDNLQHSRIGGGPYAVLSQLDSCAVQSLRKRFSQIGSAQNRLFLRSQKGTVLEIKVSVGISMLQRAQAPAMFEKSFRNIPSPAGCHFKLQVAEWDCGSKAFLDSRGLLHLVSSSSDVPQISLVLHEGRMSGWCESGGAFGLRYSMPDGSETTLEHDREIFVEAVEGFLECLGR